MEPDSLSVPTLITKLPSRSAVEGHLAFCKITLPDFQRIKAFPSMLRHCFQLFEHRSTIVALKIVVANRPV